KCTGVIDPLSGHHRVALDRRRDWRQTAGGDLRAGQQARHQRRGFPDLHIDPRHKGATHDGREFGGYGPLCRNDALTKLRHVPSPYGFPSIERETCHAIANERGSVRSLNSSITRYAAFFDAAIGSFLKVSNGIILPSRPSTVGNSHVG